MVLSINYVVGDVTRPQTEGSRIIAHICNNHGRWGRGVTVAISSRWESPERFYRQWHRSGFYDGIPFQMGKVQFIDVGYNPQDLKDRGLWVANMVAQDGLRSRDNPKPVCYQSLRDCLESLCKKAICIQAEVIMPRIGTGLGGGDWKIVEMLITEELILNGVQVTVYDPKDWS